MGTAVPEGQVTRISVEVNGIIVDRLLGHIYRTRYGFVCRVLGKTWFDFEVLVLCGLRVTDMFVLWFGGLEGFCFRFGS